MRCGATSGKFRDHFALRRECLDRMLIFGEAHASIVDGAVWYRIEDHRAIGRCYGRNARQEIWIEWHGNHRQNEFW
jgi:hypothetical protein